MVNIILHKKGGTPLKECRPILECFLTKPYFWIISYISADPDNVIFVATGSSMIST